jgi:hypothetical protein
MVPPQEESPMNEITARQLAVRACVALATLCGLAEAATIEPTPAVKADPKASKPICAVDAFGAFEDNYVLLVNDSRQPGWVDASERAVRGQVSVKYSIAGEPYFRVQERRSLERCEPKPPTANWELFAGYTNVFDFYLGSRSSDPVVMRSGNVGLFVRIPLRVDRLFGNRHDQLLLSIEHLSNGQPFDASTPEGIQRANRAYERRDRAFFDSVSRGGNFIAADLSTLRTWSDVKVDLRAKLKWHFGRDENTVFWGPQAGHTVRDYDLLLLHAGVGTGGKFRVELDWRLGRRGLATDSFTLGAQFMAGPLPFYVRYHHGPFGNLANFTQEERSLGVGFRFAFD